MRRRESRTGKILKTLWLVHPWDCGWLFIRGVREICFKYGVELIHVDNMGNVTVEGNVETHVMNCVYEETKNLAWRLLGLADFSLLTRFLPLCT